MDLVIVQGGILFGMRLRDCWKFAVTSGDFNIVISLEEKASSTIVTHSMRLFDELIRQNGTHDPPLVNVCFTWSNFRETPICCHLDRFLFTLGFGNMFNYIRQQVLVKCVSDHCFVILPSDPPTWGPTRIWKFGGGRK